MVTKVGNVGAAERVTGTRWYAEFKQLKACSSDYDAATPIESCHAFTRSAVVDDDDAE